MAESPELAALRVRDQTTFRSLVLRLHPTMVRVARGYVSSREVAEEVAQDTWVAVLQEMDRFEGRSSIQTWILRILTNQAKSRGLRERRTIPFPDLGRHDGAGSWPAPPHPQDLPEERLLSAELGDVLQRAVDGLPPAQRAVVLLRDVLTLSAQEVCALLDLSEANQRVLLHRGRLRVREAVTDYVGPVELTA